MSTKYCSSISKRLTIDVISKGWQKSIYRLAKEVEAVELKP